MKLGKEGEHEKDCTGSRDKLERGPHGVSAKRLISRHLSLVVRSHAISLSAIDLHILRIIKGQQNL